MMFQYKCLNPISPCGTSLFTEEYKQVEELQKADAVLVRSAASAFCNSSTCLYSSVKREVPHGEIGFKHLY